MKLHAILSTALVAGAITATAATQPVAAPVGTNASPEATMKALFGDPVIAKGTGFEIKQSDLDVILSGVKANAAAQGQTLPPAFTVAILNQLITIQSLNQKANAADKAAGLQESELQYSNLVKAAGSADAFERRLKLAGMSLTDLKSKAAQEATAKTVLKRELKVSASEDEVKAFYAKHAAEFEMPETVHARHILLMTIDPSTREPLPTNAVAGKKKEIEGLLKQARDGADFAALASKYSEDPGSKENGGELPEFPRGQMVPEFETAAFALTNNQVSDVVTTMYGFHIIKSLGKTPAKKYALNDTLPQINKTVADICKSEVESEKIKELAPAYLKQLRTELKVEVVDPDLKSLEEAVRAQAESADASATNEVPASPAK